MASILITGTGLIGSILGDALEHQGHQVRFLSQSKRNFNGRKCFHWNVTNKEIDPDSLVGVDHIVHLAGAGIADKRWTAKRKQELFNSRVKSAELLYSAIEEQGSQIKTLISASGVGYYGAKTMSHIYTENDNPGKDFLGEICKAWESSAFNFESKCDRVVIFRLGIVLASKGGALNRLLPLFKRGLGSPLGKGNQYMPWVHFNDVVNAVLYVIKHKNHGVFNLVADEHVTNKTFSQQLASSVDKRILLPHIPSIAIKIRFGELSSALLYGSRVSNDKIKSIGFTFQYKKLKNALKSLVE